MILSLNSPIWRFIETCVTHLQNPPHGPFSLLSQTPCFISSFVCAHRHFYHHQTFLISVDPAFNDDSGSLSYHYPIKIHHRLPMQCHPLFMSKYNCFKLFFPHFIFMILRCIRTGLFPRANVFNVPWNLKFGIFYDKIRYRTKTTGSLPPISFFIATTDINPSLCFLPVIHVH